MTQAAAFQATFCDWRLIKGRKVVQVVFEVPIELADEAYRVLGGMPDPGKSVWCAIARLQPNLVDTAVVSIPAVREAGGAQPRKLPAAAPASRTFNLANHIGKLCANDKFHSFLADTVPNRWKLLNDGTPTEKAAVIVRSLCEVKSRAEIESNPEALNKWQMLFIRYNNWQRNSHD